MGTWFPKSAKRKKSIVKVLMLLLNIAHEYEVKRDDLPYEIDGMVIKSK